METIPFETTVFRLSDGTEIPVEQYDFLPKVSEVARARAQADCPDTLAVFAERSFRAGSKTPESGVFLSLIMHPTLFASQAGALGALIAVAVQSALKDRTSKPVGIGWGGDIYCGGRRIGTSSVESKLNPLGAFEYLTCHISLALSETDFPLRLCDAVAQVFENNVSLLSMIANDITDKFFRLYRDIRQPAKIMETYRQKFILFGTRAVYLTPEGKRKRCRILNVDCQTGKLLISLRGGKVVYLNGKTNILLPDKIRKRTRT